MAYFPCLTSPIITREVFRLTNLHYAQFGKKIFFTITKEGTLQVSKTLQRIDHGIVRYTKYNRYEWLYLLIYRCAQLFSTDIVLFCKAVIHVSKL